MKKSDVKDTAELIGIAAIVASLIFVGMQMKQSQDIALSQASQTRTAMSVETIISSTENPYFVSALAKGRRGEEKTQEEQAATRQYALAILFAYEDQYFQYTNGFLAEERWQASKRSLRRFMSDASTIPVRHAYERFPGRYSSSFQNVVNTLIAEVDGETKRN